MITRRQALIGGAATSVALQAPALLAQPREVVIGVIFPMSGPSAQIGRDARFALETALEIVNGQYDFDLPTARHAGLPGLGNAKVRLVFADHQGDPQKGRAEAERLITQERVCAIVGAYHSSVAATASVSCERYATPLVIGDSTSPNLTRRNLKFFFRTTAHDEMFSVAMFDFLDAQRAAGKQIKSIALFHEDTIFGTDSSNVQRQLAKARGYNVTADVKYRANTPSLTSEVQQLKNADPDVLLPSSYTTDAILLVRTMAELGYKPKNILAQAAGFADQAVFDAVGDKLGGMISRASFAIDMAAQRPTIGRVNDMFKARANRDLNDNTARQFMALIVLVDAINRAKSTEGAAIRDALAATDIPGAQTIMPWAGCKFDKDGQNATANPVLIQYVNKQWVTIFPAGSAVRGPIWPMNG
ncbi:MAG: ABC transporter substrate-binding protein [Hyphomonadaceae bacterium]|jgi:branched-chain amino acid transport system substrate-binding protein|nr:ABC transporter substrate-binding protein [Hyphomonadaceae bacterium]